MKILSLDASSKATGFCYAIDGSPVDYGVMTHTGTDPLKRVLKMKWSIREKIGTIIKAGIDVVYVEDIQMQQGNAKGFKTLAWLQLAILETLEDYNLKWELVSPSSWRSKYGFQKGGKIKREELKQLAIKYCEEKLGIKDQSDDICEAILLALHK